MKTDSIKSMLFVPAKEKMLSKVGTFEADAYILDLEDSIAPEEKESALQRVDAFLAKGGNTRIYARLNSDRYKQELALLDKYDVGFMLPKFERSSDYQSEAFERHDILAIIETPLGLVNIEQIVTLTWVNAIVFGAEDFTAAVNMVDDDKYLGWQKSRVVTYAKAYKKRVYDTPSFSLDDLAAIKAETELSAAMGFDGKMSINPKQVPFINNAFKGQDIDYLKSVVSRYEADGGAVVVIDGRVFEKMHINRFKKIIRENAQ